jgi:hypothetical protein
MIELGKIYIGEIVEINFVSEYTPTISQQKKRCDLLNTAIYIYRVELSTSNRKPIIHSKSGLGGFEEFHRFLGIHETGNFITYSIKKIKEVKTDNKENLPNLWTQNNFSAQF